MITYGWRYTYRGHASLLFPDADSAVQDLVARFPATEPFAEYLLTLEAAGKEAGEVRLAVAGRADEEAQEFNVRCELLDG